MQYVLSRFTDNGIDAFEKWIRSGANGDVPGDLLTDSSFATLVPGALQLAERHFKDRFEFGQYLVQLLEPLSQRQISYDRPMWSWLAAVYFNQLCPRDVNGRRKVRTSYVYVLETSKIFYRHLVRMSWFLVATHGEACKFLLMPMPGASNSLGMTGQLLDTLGARQFLIASPTLIAAAGRLYSDPRTGKPKAGIASKRGDSPERLAVVANQLSLTFDIHDMPVDRFLALLPEEFGARRLIRG